MLLIYQIEFNELKWLKRMFEFGIICHGRKSNLVEFQTLPVESPIEEIWVLLWGPKSNKLGMGGTSTNNSGRLLADKNSTRHRALATFSIHHNRKQHPIWRLP